MMVPNGSWRCFSLSQEEIVPVWFQVRDFECCNKIVTIVKVGKSLLHCGSA